MTPFIFSFQNKSNDAVEEAVYMKSPAAVLDHLPVGHFVLVQVWFWSPPPPEETSKRSDVSFSEQVNKELKTSPLLSSEVQQPPSAPPHCSLRADTSLSSLSSRSRRAAKSVSQPQDPDPDPGGRPRGSSLILWVRTRGEPGVRSTSLPEERREEPA